MQVDKKLSCLSNFSGLRILMKFFVVLAYLAS